VTDWSMHKHRSTVGVLGSAIYDRGWCEKCMQPWPCITAIEKKKYEDVALQQLSKIENKDECVVFVLAMKEESLRIDFSQ